MNKVAAVVTTYNRLELLKENIEALLTQSYNKFDIIIVDNNSTDATENYVKSIMDARVRYFNTGANLGGAGGFSFGIKKAIELEYDFAWIMDDDTIPTKDALKELIDRSRVLVNGFSFLASTVYWSDGTLFPMNYPRIAPNVQLYPEIERLRDYKLLPIVNCSFVGCYVNLEYAKKVGLPYAEYFIYGDDAEYTTRLRKEARAYWVLDSTLVHKAPSKIGSNVVNAPIERIDRFYMQTRNGMHLHRKHGGVLNYILILLQRLKNILLHSPDYKMKRVSAVVRGFFAGVFFNPMIEYVANEKKEKLKNV